MNAAWIGVAGTIAGGVIGALASMGTTFAAHLAARRQSEDARDQASDDRRHSFELDYLIQVSAALDGFGRAAGRVHHVDTMTGKTSGMYASTQVGEDDSNNLNLQFRRVLGLAHFILDDDVRRCVEQAITLMNYPSTMRDATIAQGEAAFAEGIVALDEAFKSVGARVRTLYALH